jgi:hypothetical protein
MTMQSSPTRPMSSGEPTRQGDKGGGSPYRRVNIKAAALARWLHSSMVSGVGGGGVLVRWAGEVLRDLLQLGAEGGGVEGV